MTSCDIKISTTVSIIYTKQMDIHVISNLLFVWLLKLNIPSAYSHWLFCYHIYNEEAVMILIFTKMAIKFCLKGSI